MPALIQKLHPAVYPGPRLMLRETGQPLFSRQGDWDGGSALHCAAMALTLLGKPADPVDVRSHASGAVAHFWDRAWPHYLHGLTLSELAGFISELGVGVRPTVKQDRLSNLLPFC